MVVIETSLRAKRRVAQAMVGSGGRPDRHLRKMAIGTMALLNQGEIPAIDPFAIPRHHPRMSVRLPPCPYLPPPQGELDWRRLHTFRDDHRGAEFYEACLEYAHSLWQRGLAARAVLCLDRALGAELSGAEPILKVWPLPYAAMVWFLRHTPPTVFIGNPRVHFQHYADRMNDPRREQRAWRAWACWALARAARPEFPADPRHAVVEPSLDEIATGLAGHGHPDETELWRSVLITSGS